MGGRRKPKDERIQEIKKLQETCERIQENEVRKKKKKNKNGYPNPLFLWGLIREDKRFLTVIFNFTSAVRLMREYAPIKQLGIIRLFFFNSGLHKFEYLQRYFYKNFIKSFGRILYFN